MAPPARPRVSPPYALRHCSLRSASEETVPPWHVTSHPALWHTFQHPRPASVGARNAGWSPGGGTRGPNNYEQHNRRSDPMVGPPSSADQARPHFARREAVAPALCDWHAAWLMRELDACSLHSHLQARLFIGPPPTATCCLFSFPLLPSRESLRVEPLCRLHSRSLMCR